MRLFFTINFLIFCFTGFSQWEVVSEGVDSEWNHNKIDFINQDTGIIIGNHATAAEPNSKNYILTTHDGGITFDTTMYQPYTKTLLDIHFFNDTIAYLISRTCCNRIEILKSIDAGNTWNTICDSVPAQPNSLMSTMQFTSIDNGVINLSTGVFYTTDGGSTWTGTTYQGGVESSAKHTDTIALAYGFSFAFSNTQFNQYDSLNIIDYNIGYMDLKSINFIDGNNIIVGGRAGNGLSYGYPENSFGKTAVVNLQDFSIIEVDFPSLHSVLDIKSTSNRVFASNWAYQNPNELIIMSDNGGETWHQSEIIDNNGFNASVINSIDFVNDSVGYALQRSTIYRTTNAGGPLGPQVGTIIQGASSITENTVPFELNVYPNPTDNILNIEAPFNSNLELHNISGKLIKSFSQSTDKTQIDVSNIASGVYLLKVLNDAGTVTRKIIIN